MIISFIGVGLISNAQLVCHTKSCVCVSSIFDLPREDSLALWLYGWSVVLALSPSRMELFSEQLLASLSLTQTITFKLQASIWLLLCCSNPSCKLEPMSETKLKTWNLNVTKCELLLLCPGLQIASAWPLTGPFQAIEQWAWGARLLSKWMVYVSSCLWSEEPTGELSQAKGRRQRDGRSTLPRHH